MAKEVILNSEQEELWKTAYAQGAAAEQERIQSVLQMMFESELNLGHGTKAVHYRNTMELLTPVEIDYSEERYYEDLRNDGF